jgi:hypothetical protein
MAHKAFIKNFHVEQKLKSNGIEIGVWQDDKQFGDAYVAKTGFAWRDGKTHRDNGIRFSSTEISLTAAYKDEAIKAAKKAKKDAAKKFHPSDRSSPVRGGGPFAQQMVEGCPPIESVTPLRLATPATSPSRGET